MYLVSNAQPKFSSADNVATSVGRWLAESRRSEKREAEIRQQVLQELQQQAQDRFTPTYTMPMLSPPLYKPPSAIRFGILGEAVWNPMTGRTNSSGLSTYASNGGRPEHILRTSIEAAYKDVQDEWRRIKHDPGVSQARKNEVYRAKQELKPLAESSTSKKNVVSFVVSAGLSQLPGPLGVISQPVAAVIVDILETKQIKELKAKEEDASDDSFCVIM
jgi:hypothetical protein